MGGEGAIPILWFPVWNRAGSGSDQVWKFLEPVDGSGCAFFLKIDPGIGYPSTL